MKKVIGIIIVVVVIIYIFTSILGTYINLPSLLNDFGKNIGIHTTGDGDCKNNLVPGYYDVQSKNTNNNFNGKTIGEGVTYKNQNSKSIKNYTTCYGEYEYIPTDIRSVDFMSETYFELEPGTYIPGKNIDYGTYEVSADNHSNEKIYIFSSIEVMGGYEQKFYEAKAGETIKFEAVENQELDLYVYKDNILGTDEIIDKKLKFKKV